MSTTVHMRACAIVNRILADLCDRSGLQNEWEAIDHDIQDEIKDSWIDIATQEIAR